MLLRSKPEALVVLQLNVTAAMPEETREASPLVWQGLTRYLRSHSESLKTLPLADARDMWLDSIRGVRAADPAVKVDFDDALRAFAKRLALHAEYDALLVPTLFVQQAEISASHIATWDGAQRELEVDESLGGREAVRVEGHAPAASLHVVVVDAQGERLHEAQAGLELLVRVGRSRDQEGSEGVAFEPRTNLFQDPEVLRESIARALAPFLER